MKGNKYNILKNIEILILTIILFLIEYSINKIIYGNIKFTEFDNIFCHIIFIFEIYLISIICIYIVGISNFNYLEILIYSILVYILSIFYLNIRITRIFLYFIMLYPNEYILFIKSIAIRFFTILILLFLYQKVIKEMLLKIKK